jgi:stearoyl-CoA desaturase (delta-9 desaturase)
MSVFDSFDAWTGLGAPRIVMVPVFVVIMVLVAMGVVVAYHRVLTHRAAVLARPVELVLVLFGLGAGTPVQWIGNHRFHHAHTDEPEDTHSPRHHGFWVAHCGWYLQTHSTALSILYAFAGPLRTLFDAFWRPRTNQQHVALAKDIAADPILGWLSRPAPYALTLLSTVVVAWSGFVLAWGIPGAAALWALHVMAYSFGDLVNSAGHMVGTRPYTDRDDSTDSPWLAVLTFGDGWHNAHHAFPGSIRCGLKPLQWDPAFWFTLALSKVGLAHSLRIATPADVLSKHEHITRKEAA